MEKTEQFRKLDGTFVDHYVLSRVFSTDDIPQITKLLTENGVAFQSFRLSNSLEQPDHFFRVFFDLKDLLTCPTEDYWIDDFGVDGEYNNKDFSLTFEIGTNRLFTITTGDISLEPLLLKLENLC